MVNEPSVFELLRFDCNESLKTFSEAKDIEFIDNYNFLLASVGDMADFYFHRDRVI